MSAFLKLLITACLLILAAAFSPSPSLAMRQTKRMEVSMGNNAQFGIFSPAVIAAKFVLGEAKLNKVVFLFCITLFIILIFQEALHILPFSCAEKRYLCTARLSQNGAILTGHTIFD